MRDCDIKFVNKEITPFGGLSLFFKMLEKCHFEEHVMQSGVPLQGSNRGYNPIQLILGLFAGVWCGVEQAALAILTWYVMTLHYVIYLGGNVEQTIVHTSAISTNSPKLSTSVFSEICSVGFSQS